MSHRLGHIRLSAAELNVMAVLAEGEPPTLTSLAGRVGSRATTVSSVVDRLEQRGLARRRPHPQDRRALRIEPTRQGRRVAEEVRGAFDELEHEAFGRLSKQSIAGFRRTLTALMETSHV